MASYTPLSRSTSVSYSGPSLSSARPSLSRDSLARLRGGSGGWKEWINRPGVSGVEYEKYVELFYSLAFVVVLILAFYFKDDTAQTKNLSYTSAVLLGLVSVSGIYAGYSSYRSKNLYYGIGAVFGALCVAQSYYLYLARDDVAGTTSLEQERANMITNGGAVAGAIAAIFVLTK
jgi:hypothetical protein